VSIVLAEFQKGAVSALLDAMEQPNREIVLKSCTGSGKTIMLTCFMDEYLRANRKTVFVWLTPGRGDLEEQSREKMDRYIHGSSTKSLLDVMTGGFEENDVCFINWEKLTKKGNNALKEGERINFIEHVGNALTQGLAFKIIVDESHQNDTIKADDIIELFRPDKIIRCSATPKNYRDAILIRIPEEDVILAGLIKKLLIINEDFPRQISVADQVSYLIGRALSKQRELHAALLQRGSAVNPLMIVQLPNRSDALLGRVEEYFNSQGITYENGLLAVWLSDKKQNIGDISRPDAAPIAVIIKQAIATGWDCPRAYILVKLRDNMDETFEVQTIGRIRRMPEARHYESDLLDCCYLYTLDEKFTQGVKLSLGAGALDACKLFLKPEHRAVSLISEYKTEVPFPQDGRLALRVAGRFFALNYQTGPDTRRNREILESSGYLFSGDVVRHTKSGAVSALEPEGIAELDDVLVHEALDTHRHGKEYHHCVARLGRSINLDYAGANTVVRRLFLEGVKSEQKLLSLSIRSLYAFVINNAGRLAEDLREAMASEAVQMTVSAGGVTEKPFAFPPELLFTYDGTAKSQVELTKNVYQGYLASAERRSAPEKLFERYCQSSGRVSWFYKNGDKGAEYLSIVYEDNFGKQRSFYPDYVVGAADGDVWIIETKGGFTRSGESEDIDRYTAKKFAVLKRYLSRHSLRGGIVRQDEQSRELCICTEHYSDDIKSDDWILLSELL